ncbi:MAG: hypothetical protein H0T47_18580 [Planctomycetaceae bacterium]|nr:hypothetical protein [Planctomycetaceae bacterium]
MMPNDPRFPEGFVLIGGALSLPAQPRPAARDLSAFFAAVAAVARKNVLLLDLQAKRLDDAALAAAI